MVNKTLDARKRAAALWGSAILSLFLALCMSCSVVGGTGVVKVSFGSPLHSAQGVNRTVVPDFLAGVQEFRITLTDTAGNHADHVETITDTSATDMVFSTVEVGTWDVLVEARANGETFVSGSLLGLVVTAGASSDCSITLVPEVSDGTSAGDMALGVSFPSSTGIDSLVWSIEYNAGGVVPGFGPFTISSFGTDGSNNSTATISASNITSGSYSLILEFRRGTTVAGVFSESVNIWNGLTSDKWVSSVDDNSDGKLDLLSARTFAASEFFESNATLASLFFVDAGNVQLADSFTSNMVSTLDMGLVARAPLTFTPVGSVSGQEIIYSWNSGASKAAYNGESSRPLNMVPGPNYLQITVTAPDRSATHTYNITFYWVQNYTSSSSVAMEMVQVEGGSFTMGVDAPLVPSRIYMTPSHPVTVSDFLIGKYEVTQGQYYAVMEDNPTSTGSPWNGSAGDELNPVSGLTFIQAMLFCNKLSALEGLEKVYPEVPVANSMPDMSKNGYRLPTDAEWEFAAKGGNRSNNYTYPGSNSPTQVANYDFLSDNSNSIKLVGQYAPNELGLYDMGGNVWEMTNDRINSYGSVYQTYDLMLNKDPLTPQRPFDDLGALADSNVYISIRGGSASSQSDGGKLQEIACVSREPLLVSTENDSTGFRVVRSAAAGRPLLNMVSVDGGTESSTGVVVADMQMSQTEITQRQFQLIMGFNYSDDTEAYLGDDIPVGAVSWFDALMFCNKLSRREGLEPVYTITGITYDGDASSSIDSATVQADFSRNGYRLPTHSERIWAARGLATTTYWWGDTLANYTNREWCAGNAPFVNTNNLFLPVGRLNANGYGLYDMAGNMAEWGWGNDSSTTSAPKVYGSSCRAADTYLNALRSSETLSGNEGGSTDFDHGFRVVRGSISSHTITYQANGGTFVSEASESFLDGVPAKLYSGADITNGTLELIGFRDNLGGTGTFYLPGGSYSFTGNVTLYAQWGEIGAFGPGGGYIFYDQGSVLNGWRYLEASKADVATTGYPWAESEVTISPLTNGGYGLGYGDVYTQLIVTETAGQAGTNAARMCSELVQGGCSDWYLPTTDELQVIRTLFYDITTPIGDFCTGSVGYWSSDYRAATVGNFGTNYCFYVNFDSDATYGGDWAQNSTYFAVRAVRAF